MARGDRETTRQSTVLVVDDDEDARVIVSMVLGAAGAEVKSAASVQQGLAALREFRAHVLVSDVVRERLDESEAVVFDTRRRVRLKGIPGRHLVHVATVAASLPE